MIFNNLSLLLTTTIIFYYLPCVFAGPETNDAGIPSYVFAIVVIVLVIIILVALFFIIRLIRHRRKVKNRTSKANTTVTTETTEPYTSTTIEEKKLSPITHTTTNQHESIEIDRYYSEDSSACPPVLPLSSSTNYEDIKITLPLPPASTSLFSDKVELSSDEAAELYKKYMNGDGGFVLIEDTNNNNNNNNTNHRRFSTTMQQKAATIRSTLRQSLRRQRSLKNVSSSSQTPLKDLFDRSPSQHSSVSGASSSSFSSSTSSSKRMPPPPSPLPSYSTTTTNNTIIVPTPPSPALTSPRTPNTPVTPLTPAPPFVTRPFSEKVALDENYQYQEETPIIKYDDAEPYINHNTEQSQNYTPPIPPTPTLTITPESKSIMPSGSQLSSQRSSMDNIEDKEMKIEQEQNGQQNRKVLFKTAETEARKVIEFASIRSKRRSFLTDPQREEEKEEEKGQEQKELNSTASSSHSDFSRNNPSVRDIISWWQKEPSIKSSPSGHSITPSTLTKSKHVEQQQEEHDQLDSTPSSSLLSPSLQQQQQHSLIDSPISNETAKATSPTSVRELSVSRQSSLMRPASSLFTSVNETPRASLNSLSRLSTAERMVIMGGNNSMKTKANNVESVRQSLQATWSSGHSSTSSSSTTSSTTSQQSIQSPSQHQHLLSMRGQHHWQQRPAMPEEFMNEPLEGPVPTASFSSSTVRTMIPECEYQEQAIASSKNTNNKIQQQQQGSFNRNNPINQRQSISPTITTSSTRKNVSSLKSSVNKTTHINTVASKKQTISTATPTTNTTGTYSTMRGGRKQQRGSIPWLQNNDNNPSNPKSPAQREKDRYLYSLKK
ncbi:hypothetical protein INT45_007155 [Circinella minor]|uniref:Uncharacterized protein n=1 Tax=Circinella minor TaxID=1195481 RepID=A0A8H7S2Z3_9FUNG|nr:hypothetical protein INT45_007155 [Circinella minor]